MSNEELITGAKEALKEFRERNIAFLEYEQSVYNYLRLLIIENEKQKVVIEMLAKENKDLTDEVYRTRSNRNLPG